MKIILNEEEFRALFERIWLKAKCLDRNEGVPESHYKEEVFNSIISELGEKKMVFTVFGEATQSKTVIKGEDLVDKKEETQEKEEEKKDEQAN